MWLLEDLGVSDFKLVILYWDNQFTIHIAKNPIFNERIKQIKIYYHFTLENILEGLI